MSNAPVGHAAGAVVPPPLALQQARRWLHWAAEPRTRRDGTTVLAKVPYYATGGRRYGDLESDAARLVTYAEARIALGLYGAARAGLGFALGQGWQGIDLDKINDRPTLAALVHELPSYVETSPSGTGVHAIGQGAAFATLGSNASGIEAYSTGRFFTFTGQRVNGSDSLVDLAPFVAARLAPIHATGRRAPGALLERPVIDAVGDRTIDELADALRFLDADDRDTWVGVGQELVSLGEVGYRLWAAWSGTASRFPGGDDLERWATFKGDRTGYAAVFVRAEAQGWKNPRRLDAAAIFAGSTFAGPLPMSEEYPADPRDMAPASAPTVPPVPTSLPAPRLGDQGFRMGDGAQRAATLENVLQALEGSVHLTYDSFQDLTLIGIDGELRPINKTDKINLRIILGKGGFKPVGVEIMDSVVEYLAQKNKCDTARDWVKRITWDQIPRIDNLMRDYYGWEDSLYSRAVGAYLMTALAGRALVPGCQADMAVILVGLQGVGKTSAVRALAPFPLAFGEVDLSKRDADLARQARGKMIVEWAEMRGLAGRDRDGITAWITRRREEWIPKHIEYATVFERRFVIIGTANMMELLDDPTGERRWLPGVTGAVDVAGLTRDCTQLWAEGAARFNVGGVEWELAERLARDEHAQFKVHDEWANLIADWLEAMPVARFGEVPSPVPNGDGLFTLHECASAALGLPRDRLSRSDELRIGKILRNFGYDKFQIKDGTLNRKKWRHAGLRSN